MPVCSQILSCRPAKGRAHLEPELALQPGAWHAKSRAQQELRALRGSRREGEMGGADTRMCWAWQSLERCTRCS